MRLPNPLRIRLHAYEPASRANGPGLRAVVWFQGCTLGCAGCFNPATHNPIAGYVVDTDDLAAQILNNPNPIEGVSFSGGEPFQQAGAFLEVLNRLSSAPFSKLAFSGYSIKEIRSLPQGEQILQRLDVLIDGRYIQKLHWGRNLRGSSNQQVHLLSTRYTLADFADAAMGEVILHRDGNISVSGFNPTLLKGL